jgi:hypothetical protein
MKSLGPCLVETFFLLLLLLLLLLLFSRFLYSFLRRRIFLFTYGSFRHLVGLLGLEISPAPRPLPT